MLQKKSVSCIIRGRLVITMDTEQSHIQDGAIAILDDTIVAVDRYEELAKRYTPAMLIEAPDDAILPGFINTHTHTAMTLFRGVADDAPLDTWLHKEIIPLEQQLIDADFVICGTQLGALEMMRNGITTAVDMYWHESAAAHSFAQLGMRAVTGPTICTLEDLDTGIRFVEQWKQHPLITPALAPPSLPPLSEALLKKIPQAAQRHDVQLLTHIAETTSDVASVRRTYQCSPFQLLEKYGWTDIPLTAAHAVHVTDEDITLIKKYHIGVAHCPTSNMKLASGIAPVAKMLREYIKVGLGTDGAASNNALNMLEELKLAILLQRVATTDAHALHAMDALHMATKMGAQAIHKQDIGSLAVGKKADIISIRLNSLHQLPSFDAVSTLAYATQAQDVKTVIINGIPQILNGAWCHHAPLIEELMHKVEKYRSKIQSLL